MDDVLRGRTDILRELRHNLLLARERMKNQADQHCLEVNFNVRDHVYLKLQPYRQKSVAFRSCLKLSPRYFGPFWFLVWVGLVAYRLELPKGSMIQDVFHVSLLKQQLGPLPVISSNLPPVSDSFTQFPQPESVLDSHIVHKGNYRLKTEILVKWVGASVEYATWEKEWQFLKTYPNFIFEDKDTPGQVD